MFNFEKDFGSKLFSDSVMKQRLRPEIYDAVIKIRDEGMAWDPAVADEVAEAMKNWAMEQGATHFVHWFSPLTGTNSGRHDSFLDGIDTNKPFSESMTRSPWMANAPPMFALAKAFVLLPS